MRELWELKKLCAVCGRPESVHRTTELPKDVRDRLTAEVIEAARDMVRGGTGMHEQQLIDALADLDAVS